MIDLEPNEDVDFEITANLSESYGGFEIDPETVQFDLYRDGELVSRLGNLKTTEFERIAGQALKI
jgi:hypothetical protein